jgi:TnpA family transposase/signal recognition particle subunit SEC65
MPRMQILSPIEQRAFNTPPPMNAAQRKSAFDLPVAFQREADQLRDPVHKIGFCLNAGYFRRSRRCFAAENFQVRDIGFVANQLGYEAAIFESSAYPIRTRQRHEQAIERLSGFRRLDTTGDARLVLLIEQKVTAHEKPKTIFYAVVEHLAADRSISPGYRSLQDLILGTIAGFRSRQLVLVAKHMTKDIANELESLLGEDEGQDAVKRHRLTILKQNTQSVRPMVIKARVANHTDLAELFHQVEPIVTVLGWDQNSTRAYALAVMKSDVHDLRRRKTADRQMHLIAFVVYQYYNLQDNLVATLLNAVKAAENSATREFKDWCFAERKSQAAKLQARIQAFEAHFQTAMATLQSVFNAADLSDTDKLTSLRLLLFPVDAKPVLSDEILKDIKETTLSSENDDLQYFGILEARSRRLQNQVAGLLKSLTFRAESHIRPLLAALEYFREVDGLVTRSAPMGFLDPSERKAVGSDAGFRPSLYKVLLFQHVSKAIKSGAVNLPQSHRYRPLDDYLITSDQWRRERSQLLTRAEMTAFSEPDSVLLALKEALDNQFLVTNKHIADGTNTHVKQMPSGHLRLNTPKMDEIEATAMSQYFPQRHYVPLTEILSTVNEATGFADSLAHLQQQYARPVSRAVLFAGVIGLGCGIGLRKMARISGTIKEDALEHAANWHFSRENLISANDRVVAFMDGLELPEIYRRKPGQSHTASDGQKFEVTVDSLNANRSYKYFGKGQGVSAYTYISDKILLWYSTVFSAAERDSAYVIDGLMHDDVVRSTIHSTDTHGYSEVIFGVTHFLGISYAPRIKSLKRQTLYGFRPTSQEDRKSWVVQPHKYADEDMVRTHWDEILRLVVTIKLKMTTASDIFRRLNSYSKQNSLYTALKAFGRIVKTLFVLRYIDDIELRMAIEGLLNKIELANRFTRAVAVGSPRDFIFALQEDQQVAESCNRLIKNAIICWNYLYLEMRLRTAEPAMKAEMMLAIKAHSPQSWAHVNMLGEYDFSEDKLTDTFGVLPPKSAL